MSQEQNNLNQNMQGTTGEPAINNKSPKKSNIVLIICIVIAVLLLIVPIPQTLKDGGTIYLSPIVPMYEIYIFNMEWFDNQTMKGWAINLFGIEIYESTYYVNE